MQANGRTKLVIDDQRNGIFRVNRSVFVSPEILELERRNIFDRSWLYVGHESEVRNPGDFVTRDVGGRPVIMSHGADGQIRVLINSCTHRGAQVCRESDGNAKSFQCFYHAWTFNNQGDLIGVPDAAGYGGAFRRETLSLKAPARTTNYRGMIFLSFDPAIEDFVDYLADAKEVLDVILDQAEDGMEIAPGSQKYSFRANWKLLVENSIDGYHLRSTHHTYLEYLRSTGADFNEPVRGHARALGNGHGVIEHTGPMGRPCAKWEPRWGEKVKGEMAAVRRRLAERYGEKRADRITNWNRNLHIYPSLIVNDIMSLTVRTWNPIAPDYLEVSAWAMTPRNEGAQWRAIRLDNFLTFLGPGGFATPDDLAALDSCQLGFRASKEVEWSDISRGMVHDADMSDEEQMRSFWRRWSQQIEDGSAARRRAVA
ncbi:MAG: Rieske 2Fe-2S domain-containing protein [Candidatus Binataceae bacterium]|nr:Rieske 2Fe-2S domain-containing protein [Candidatus Binataceae bacterium]